LCRTELMRVISLGSGSTGNALLLLSQGTRVLIDAGVTPKLVESRLFAQGIALPPGELHGIIATHQHGDHFSHAAKLASAFGAPLYLHAGIPDPRGMSAGARPQEPQQPQQPLDVRRYAVGRELHIGALTIASVHVPHDVSQVALRIDDGDSAFGVATDVGRVTADLTALLSECDAALVEANHCAHMLAFSDYPESVKRRISSSLGHLSNDQTAELAARLIGSRLTRLWLGHLSQSNNKPERALEVVASQAKRIDVEVISAADTAVMDVRATRPRQLGLPFG